MNILVSVNKLKCSCCIKRNLLDYKCTDYKCMIRWKWQWKEQHKGCISPQAVQLSSRDLDPAGTGDLVHSLYTLKLIKKINYIKKYINLYCRKFVCCNLHCIAHTHMYSHLDILYLYSWSSKWKSLHVKTYTYTTFTHTHQSPHVSLRLHSDLGRRARTMQTNCTQERTRQGTAEAWKNTSSGKFHVAFYAWVWKVLDGSSPTAILKFQNA